MTQKTLGELVAILVGQPRELTYQRESWSRDDGRESWISSFCKTEVAGPVLARRTNLDGDAQADLVNHGGVDKAVCVYSLDHYAFWRAEFAKVEIEVLPPGAFGENFSVTGLNEAEVCIGDSWRVGSALFQVSQPRQPCWKLARRWNIKTLAARVIETGKTGWYLRVIEEGAVEAGAAVTRVARPCPDWTIKRANFVMHEAKKDASAARELAAVEWLSESWRAELRKRF